MPGELTLTLLEPHHIDSYRWAYTKQRDANKSVATLCNLPKFHNDDEWRNWLHTCRRYPNHYLYAVIHQEWGFIGSVCLEVFNGTGFFYYWLGEDFQGYGFGPQAVTILLKMGEQQKGMRCCYAKVYDHNLPSQKALTKIGFTALPIQVSSADNNEKWYYFGPDKTERQWRNELRKLIADMGSDYQIVATKEDLLRV
ncbi:GNAT family N-acetyltransferase [Vibrio gazogenes]|uniref:N-acetyltransferase domain-containing protein n=1 Tax=Vibrio gazogenes TaxID=687 RepID=A0A1Z2SJG1_VIBGA|nr:GNAT family N-acetyltransferase [Vibrio gazogenes]ASA57323.1 hypothetical protein BSQ33_16180 [Vibrio gazogenes]